MGGWIVLGIAAAAVCAFLWLCWGEMFDETARPIKNPARPPDSFTREEARRIVADVIGDRERSKAAMTSAGKGLTSR